MKQAVGDKILKVIIETCLLTEEEKEKTVSYTHLDVYKRQLFTHFGISGPLTLSASSHLRDMKKHRYIAEIDLKPALSEEQLLSLIHI